MEQVKVGQRLSVIDLGTNTFHILIADQIGPNRFQEVFRQRVFVKLGEEGIETIGERPFQRGLNTILDFQKILKDLQVDQVTAFGTAALRTATNGQNFIEKVKEISGISIKLIDGQQEAEYIYWGVVRAVSFTKAPQLIMDIGGGSVEFIIADESGILWAQSFPIGLSVLYRKFHHSDPIATHEIQQLNQFLWETLQPLFEQLKSFPVCQLIGAAGTFDVVDQSPEIQANYPSQMPIPTPMLSPMLDYVVKSTLEERLKMETLPQARADMIVVAFLLIKFIIQNANIETLVISAYALKEGIMYEMMENKE